LFFAVSIVWNTVKPELQRQDLEGIHLPSFRNCQVDFGVFESWQTAEDVLVLPCLPRFKNKKIDSTKFL
jgi:hypothetical protein